MKNEELTAETNVKSEPDDKHEAEPKDCTEKMYSREWRDF